MVGYRMPSCSKAGRDRWTRYFRCRLMAASVTNIYDVLDVVKNEVDCICAQENVSPLLIWLLLRQQADYQLLLLQNPVE